MILNIIILVLVIIYIYNLVILFLIVEKFMLKLYYFLF